MCIRDRITNSDGTKFGKSEGNAIWLDPELTSPYAFYQFWLNTADADVVDRLKVFTFRTSQEIVEFERKVAEEPFRREAQKQLAWDVTMLVHGAQATEQAIAASEAVFGKGDLGALDEQTLAAVIGELPSATVGAEDRALIDLLVATGLSTTRSEARRTLQEGGVSVNNRKVQGIEAQLEDEQLLHGRYALLKRGKKNMAGVMLGE